MIGQAVQMAQVVVDIIKTVISIVSAALSSAYIPGWGQWKATKTVKEAITLVNNARAPPPTDCGRPRPAPPPGHRKVRVPQPPGPTGLDIDAARRELQATLASAREGLDRRRAAPVHTPDERAELHQDALAGRLGEDMQRLAQRIEDRDESRQEVFEGIAPHGDLFAAHLNRMSDEHVEAIRIAIEEDEQFDPLAPDPELT